MRSLKGRAQYTALSALPHEFLFDVPGDSPPIRMLALVLRTAQGLEEKISIGDLSEIILREVPRIRWVYVLEFISNSPHVAEDRAINLLELCCEKIKRHDLARFARIQTLLKSKLDSRRSRLNETALCTLLSLPSEPSALTDKV